MPEQAHELAYKLAWEQLASVDIEEEICSKTGAQYVIPRSEAPDAKSC